MARELQAPILDYAMKQRMDAQGLLIRRCACEDESVACFLISRSPRGLQGGIACSMAQDP